MKEIYISVDIETDGPIPGDYSMLSLGAVAFDENGKEIDSFEANLKVLVGAMQDKDTMEWWKTQPEAWEYCQINKKLPQIVMIEFREWVMNLEGKPVFVAYPAGFDWTFVYWYLIHFCGHSPFGFQALDLKSYVMAKLNKNFRETSKRNMPKEWFTNILHSHKAIEDAREQGLLFFQMKQH